MNRPVAALAQALQCALDARRFSGVQLQVGTRDAVVASFAMGHTAYPADDALVRPVTALTRFDTASLTKALVTSLLAMHAVAAGKMRLDQPLEALLPPDVNLTQRQPLTIDRLLAHRSGLPAWRNFYQRLDPPSVATSQALLQVRQWCAHAELDPERRQCYSDLGYILLHWALEECLAAPLDRAFHTLIASPLGLTQSAFAPLPQGLAPAECVATERCPWRGLLQGSVHDDNAWAMGGVAGHAGLFSTATDIGTIARALLRADPAPLPFDAATLDLFWSDHFNDGDTFRLGWDTPSGPQSLAGAYATPGATFGHLGFTGCSLWLDRARQAYAVLLTNRVHPRRDSDNLRTWRASVHDLAWDAIDDLAPRQDAAGPTS